MAMTTVRSAYKQGTRHLVCSSHNLHNTTQYMKNFHALQGKIKKANIDIELHIGCEVYCNSFSINNIIHELNAGIICTINDTEYVLIEFHPNEDINEMIFCINILQQHGFKPIIAHIERYWSLIEDYHSVELLVNSGALLQTNAYSLVDEKDVDIKEFARWLLQKEYVSFIGSDAHKTNTRPYMIHNGFDYINNNCSEAYANKICYLNAMNLLYQ